MEQKDFLAIPEVQEAIRLFNERPKVEEYTTVRPDFIDSTLAKSTYILDHFGLDQRKEIDCGFELSEPEKYLGVESPFKGALRRLDLGHKRYYVYTDPENRTRFCMSATTFMKVTLGLDENLANYFKEMSKQAVDAHLFYSAEYGTFLHIQAANFLKAGQYNFGPNGFIADLMIEDYFSAIPDYPLRKLGGYIKSRFRKDMAGWIQFCYDRNVRPIAIEFPIVSYEYPVAGSIDLVCEMDFNRKRVIAIVDIKSGIINTKSHAGQLHLYKRCWNEHFKELGLEVTHVFNFSPKDFRGEKPTYELKNQTKSRINIERRLALALDEGHFDSKPKPKFNLSGVIKLGQDPSEVIEMYDHEDLYDTEIEAHKAQLGYNG